MTSQLDDLNRDHLQHYFSIVFLVLIFACISARSSPQICDSLFQDSLYLSYLSEREKFDCTDLSLPPSIDQTISLTITGDFELRDRLQITEIPFGEWRTCCGKYGPCALTFPTVIYPLGVDVVNWSRKRVIAAAKRLVGTPYAHHHIPEMGGLDCSNFTAFIFNFALGIRFSSRVVRQAWEAGRRLSSDEEIQAGDLIFLYNKDHSRIAHAALYIDSKTVIDSARGGVQVRKREGSYVNDVAWVRRVID